MNKKIGILSSIAVVLLAAVLIWTGQSRQSGTVAVNNEPVVRSQAQENAAGGYTVMIYMNGSDLESKYGCATADLLEMVRSNYDADVLNIILFTGGCSQWQTDGISNDANTIYQMRGDTLYKLKDAGTGPMGDPDTLTSFIRYGVAQFPAERYGLIFWNHGGGAVVGYGQDELHPEGAFTTMKLADIDRALAAAELDEKFTFIGFDTCLMATLEMANIARPYADYLIASEEVEPGDGWDYTFLRDVRSDSTGLDIGRAAVDTFIDYYKGTSELEIATLSVVDLAQVAPVAEAVENLALVKQDTLMSGDFNRLSRARGRNRAFGSSGEDGETDMIDIKGLAGSLAGLYPNEIQTLTDALAAAVPYQRYGTPEELGGLSIYYPYANKEDLNESIEVYRSMDQLPNYTSFISAFSDRLGSEPTKPFSSLRDEKPGSPLTLTTAQRDALVDAYTTIWRAVSLPDGGGGFIELSEVRNEAIDGEGAIKPDAEITLTTLDGQIACLYDTANDGINQFYIPIRLNGDEASLVVSSGGKILGAIPVSDDVFDMQDKKVIPIEDGDRLAVRYRVAFFDETGATDDDKEKKWLDGAEFTVNGALALGSISPDADDVQMLCLTDTCNNRYFIPCV